MEPIVFAMHAVRWQLCPVIAELPEGLNRSAYDAFVSRAMEETMAQQGPDTATLVDAVAEIRASLGVRLLGTCTAVPQNLVHSSNAEELVVNSERFNTRRTLDWAKYMGACVQWLHSRGVRLRWLEVAARLDGRVVLSPAQYTHLVTAVRRDLDARGLSFIGIAGPGLSVQFAGRYLDSFDEDALDALASWSVYVWDTLKPTALSSLATLDVLLGSTIARLRSLDLTSPRQVLLSRFAVRTTGEHAVQSTCYGNVSGASMYASAVRNSHAYGMRVLALQLIGVNSGADYNLYSQLADRAGSRACQGLYDRSDGLKSWAAPLLAFWSALPANSVALDRTWETDDDVVVAAVASLERSAVILAAVNTDALESRQIVAQVELRNARLISAERFVGTGFGGTVSQGRDSRVLTVTRPASRTGLTVVNGTMPPLSALVVVLRQPVDEASMRNYRTGGVDITHRSQRYRIPKATREDLHRSAGSGLLLVFALAGVCYCATSDDKEEGADAAGRDEGQHNAVEVQRSKSVSLPRLQRAVSVTDAVTHLASSFSRRGDSNSSSPYSPVPEAESPPDLGLGEQRRGSASQRAVLPDAPLS